MSNFVFGYFELHEQLSDVKKSEVAFHILRIVLSKRLHVHMSFVASTSVIKAIHQFAKSTNYIPFMLTGSPLETTSDTAINPLWGRENAKKMLKMSEQQEKEYVAGYIQAVYDCILEILIDNSEIKSASVYISENISEIYKDVHEYNELKKIYVDSIVNNNMVPSVKIELKLH